MGKGHPGQSRVPALRGVGPAWRCASRLMTCAALSGVLVTGQPVALGQEGNAEGEIPPARLVILVDESGSLRAADVAAEIEAVRLLALSVFSGNSEIAVLGFGSSNQAGQNAVSEYCRLTPVGTEAGRRLVTACAERIHLRSNSEGNDTDHAAALQAALDLLEQPDDAGRRRIIFLLTDGELDVRNSPQYGPPAERNQRAQEIIEDRLLPRAREGNVQIWPLGYGNANLEALQSFAVGASGVDERCADRVGATPSAVVVEDAAQVVDAFLAALAAAQCGVLVDSDAVEIGPGETVERVITIPAVATDITITATKGDERITVTYVDPDSAVAPIEGEADGQVFELSGANGPVEALRVRDPKEGNWTVRFTAPGDITARLVRAQALWIGAVTALIDIDPEVPHPGDQLTVELRVRTRRQVILDPADLAGLRFTAQVHLEGREPVAVQLNDQGLDGDLFSGDGASSGIFVIPADFSGAGEVIGKIEGAGLIPDTRPIGFSVNLFEPVFDVQLLVDPPSQIEPGGSFAGTLSVISEADPMEIRVGIGDASAGATVRIEPSLFSVPTGASTADFLVTVGEQTPTGQLTFSLIARSPSDQVVRDSKFVSTEVAFPPPPPPPPQFPWWIVGLVGGLTAVVAGVVIRVRVREGKRRRSVARLLIQLEDSTGHRHSLSAGRNPGSEFWFALTPAPHPTVVEARQTTPGSYRLRRHTKPGQVVITPPGAEPVFLRLGEDLVVEDLGLRIRVTDEARKARVSKREKGRGSGSGPRSAPRPRPEPTSPDDW